MPSRASASGPCSPVAKCSESACWVSFRMLTPKRRWVLRKESRRLSSSTQMETSGGCRETEAKELAVMPWTLPGSRSTVTTVIPVAKWPITWRKSWDVTEAENIAGSVEDITGAAGIGKSEARKAGLEGYGNGYQISAIR